MIPVAMRSDPLAGRPEAEVLDLGRDVPRDRRGRKPLGRGHLGRHRSADRSFFGVRIRVDQRLPVEGRAGRVKPGESTLAGRKLYRKVLKLNFWRPADQYYEREEEIRYGVPGGVDYEWVYR